MLDKTKLEDRITALKRGLAQLLSEQAKITEVIAMQKGAISESEAILKMLDDDKRDDKLDKLDDELGDKHEDRLNKLEPEVAANGRRS